jgi:hypothetical protein
MGDHLTCGACGETDDVEAGGIYYCPNKYCSVSGAWNARLKAGYQDDKGTMSNEQLLRMRDDCRKEIVIAFKCRNRKRCRILVRCARRIRKWVCESVGAEIEEAAKPL